LRISLVDGIIQRNRKVKQNRLNA